jgi:hypothetical protein
MNPDEIGQMQRELLERVAADATALGNPITADELERNFLSTPPLPDGHLEQLIAAQTAARRALSPVQGNRQQRRARLAQARRRR